jgi:hypothetical protein
LVDQVFGVFLSLLLLLAAPFGIVHAASSFTATTAVSAAGDPTYAIIHYFRTDGDYGDHTTGDYNDFWGLHLWGAGIDAGEGTEWTSPKPFLGEDEYGRFAWVKLVPGATEVNFMGLSGFRNDNLPYFQ